MNPIKIYVVDDYLLTRITHKRYFSTDKAYKVIGDFSNAIDCIKQMDKEEADVIIMDIELPDMNGIEATKIIKQEFPKSKVIIFTSFKNQQRVCASLAYGASAYILKSDKNVDLKKVIKMVLKGECWFSSEIAKIVFSSIPKPNSSDLENLYENTKIKNCLTNRELEVLKLLIEGKTNSEIAKEIIISSNTVKAHVGNIFNKLSVKDRVQATVKAIKANII